MDESKDLISCITLLPRQELTEKQKRMAEHWHNFIKNVTEIDRLGQQIGRTSLSHDFWLSIMGLISFGTDPEFLKAAGACQQKSAKAQLQKTR